MFHQLFLAGGDVTPEIRGSRPCLLMGFQGSCLRSPLEGCTPNLNIAIDYAIDNFIHHPQCFFVGCFIEMGNL